ncbi:hypothetical protein [Halomarina pelagica]|uniref:hypothetical protein n=1 Tax=Halomarina pelagica TaxID=2961599 RepID=UPI0020C238BE|nr:hypothetical protein [Halomarina sp. BND7]
MSTIRFARLSFERKLSHYVDQRDAIERRRAALREVIDFSTNVNALLQGTDMAEKTNKGTWYFGDVQEGEDYIAARLGKQTEETGREPDEDIRGFRQVRRDDTVVSFFVIDLRSSVMAFQFRRDIGRKAPFRILRAAFNSYYNREEEISASPLVDKEEVREEIAKLKKITRVRFSSLTPPNPDSTNSSRPMHEFLADSGIDRLLFDGESDGDEDEGINLEGDALLDGGLNLAEEGYGSATIEGEDELGEEKRVTTDEKPIESEVDMADDDEFNRRTLLAEVRDALDKLED